MKNTLKLSFFFAIIAALAYVIAIPYLTPLLESTVEQVNKTQVEQVTLTQVLIASGAGLVVQTFVASLVGLMAAHKVGLNLNWIRAVVDGTEKPKWDKKFIGLSALWGVVSSVLVLFLIKFIFESRIPELAKANAEANDGFSWIGLTTIFQGGIVEELLMRLGVMTIAVFILRSIFARKKESVPSWIYWAGIIVAAVGFGVGHLPAALTVFGTLSPIVVTYVLVANSLAGIGFGYLYWKKGLEYAMIAHMTADFMLHFVLISLIN